MATIGQGGSREGDSERQRVLRRRLNEARGRVFLEARFHRKGFRVRIEVFIVVAHDVSSIARVGFVVDAFLQLLANGMSFPLLDGSVVGRPLLQLRIVARSF